MFFDELSTVADALELVLGNFCQHENFNCPGVFPDQVDAHLRDFLTDHNYIQLVPGLSRLNNLLDLIIVPDTRSRSQHSSPLPHLSDVLFSNNRLVTHEI